MCDRVLSCGGSVALGGKGVHPYETVSGGAKGASTSEAIKYFRFSLSSLVASLVITVVVLIAIDSARWVRTPEPITTTQLIVGLNIDFYTLNYVQFIEDFRQAVSIALNIPLSNIIIRSLLPGSVIVTFDLTAPRSMQLAQNFMQQYSDPNSALAHTTAFEGFIIPGYVPTVIESPSPCSGNLCDNTTATTSSSTGAFFVFAETTNIQDLHVMRNLTLSYAQRTSSCSFAALDAGGTIYDGPTIGCNIDSTVHFTAAVKSDSSITATGKVIAASASGTVQFLNNAALQSKKALATDSTGNVIDATYSATPTAADTIVLSGASGSIRAGTGGFKTSAGAAGVELFPTANDGEASIKLLKKADGSGTSAGDNWVIGHNAWSAGIGNLAIGTQTTGSVLKLVSTGAVHFGVDPATLTTPTGVLTYEGSTKKITQTAISATPTAVDNIVKTGTNGLITAGSGGLSTSGNVAATGTTSTVVFSNTALQDKKALATDVNGLVVAATYSATPTAVDNLVVTGTNGLITAGSGGFSTAGGVTAASAVVSGAVTAASAVVSGTVTTGASVPAGGQVGVKGAGALGNVRIYPSATDGESSIGFYKIDVGTAGVAGNVWTVGHKTGAGSLAGEFSIATETTGAVLRINSAGDVHLGVDPATATAPSGVLTYDTTTNKITQTAISATPTAADNIVKTGASGSIKAGTGGFDTAAGAAGLEVFPTANGLESSIKLYNNADGTGIAAGDNWVIGHSAWTAGAGNLAIGTQSTGSVLKLMSTGAVHLGVDPAILTTPTGVLTYDTSTNVISQTAISATPTAADNIVKTGASGSIKAGTGGFDTSAGAAGLEVFPTDNDLEASIKVYRQADGSGADAGDNWIIGHNAHSAGIGNLAIGTPTTGSVLKLTSAGVVHLGVDPATLTTPTGVLTYDTSDNKITQTAISATPTAADNIVKTGLNGLITAGTGGFTTAGQLQFTGASPQVALPTGSSVNKLGIFSDAPANENTNTVLMVSSGSSSRNIISMLGKPATATASTMLNSNTVYFSAESAVTSFKFTNGYSFAAADLATSISGAALWATVNAGGITTPGAVTAASVNLNSAPSVPAGGQLAIKGAGGYGQVRVYPSQDDQESGISFFRQEDGGTGAAGDVWVVGHKTDAAALAGEFTIATETTGAVLKMSPLGVFTISGGVTGAGHVVVVRSTFQAGDGTAEDSMYDVIEAQAGANALGTVVGSDVAGKITVIIDVADTPTAGDVMTVHFQKDYGVAPFVVITPATSNAKALNAWVSDVQVNSFTIAVGNVFAATTAASYSWNYIVIG